MEFFAWDFFSGYFGSWEVGTALLENLALFWLGFAWDLRAD
jgi:hypothetical protein